MCETVVFARTKTTTNRSNKPKVPTFVLRPNLAAKWYSQPKQHRAFYILYATCLLLLCPLFSCRQSRKDLDFSFAGLKNSFRMAVTKTVEENDEKTRENKPPEATQVGGREDGDDAKVHTHVDVLFSGVVWRVSLLFCSLRLRGVGESSAYVLVLGQD